MQSDHPESFLVGEEEGRGKKGAVWVWHVLQVRSETEVLSPVFFRIRFLDLVVRDVKIISNQHVGLLCEKATCINDSMQCPTNAVSAAGTPAACLHARLKTLHSKVAAKPAIHISGQVAIGKII